MANRPKGFGMTAELNNKKAAKFDLEQANEAMDWIKSVLEKEGFDSEAEKIEKVSVAKDVVTMLKDGVVLCNFINAIRPGAVKKINISTQAFKQMENINKYLTACEAVGCMKQDLFQTVDLFEGQNIPQVLNGIQSLGRKCHKIYNGPCWGPEEATANEREFTEEQLRAGEGVIGLQAGSNKGATQSGQNFGKSRHIID